MKNNGFYLRRVGHEAWLMMRGDCPDGGEHYIYPVKLNETGAYIWEMLDSGKSVEEIAGNMRDMYGISYDEALTDANELIQGLVKRGCITKNKL
jgi:hypothetical protein